MNDGSTCNLIEKYQDLLVGEFSSILAVLLIILSALASTFGGIVLF